MNTRKVILLCWVGLLLATAAHAKIVFSSTRDGVKGVYLMDDDGSNQTLIRHQNDRLVPFPYCWSPDGTQILIQTYGLSLMNADGTNVRELIGRGFGGSIGRGSFSPDGKNIAFEGLFNHGAEHGIYVLNIRTLEMKAIAPQVMLNNPDWSPDGKHIICDEWNTFGVHTTIWIMDADGHDLRKLIPTPVGGEGEFTIERSYPRWSPDGQRIVFHQQEWVDGSFYKAFRYIICDRNGENSKQLRIPKDMKGISLSWMDDGESIVFSARAPIPVNVKLPEDFEDPNANIYKYHIWTNKMTRLTNHPGTDASLDWISDDVLPVSPQGKKKVTWGKLKQ